MQAREDKNIKQGHSETGINMLTGVAKETKSLRFLLVKKLLCPHCYGRPCWVIKGINYSSRHLCHLLIFISNCSDPIFMSSILLSIGVNVHKQLATMNNGTQAEFHSLLFLWYQRSKANNECLQKIALRLICRAKGGLVAGIKVKFQ